MKKIYFDHHSMSKPDEVVIAQMLPYFVEKWGGYLQPHEEGQKLFLPLQKGYESLFKLLGAKGEDTLVFTSSRAEAIAHVYDHLYRQVVRESGRHHIITLNSEDAPILMGIKKLEYLGCHVTYLNVGASGTIPVQEIIDAINPRTSFISLSLASGMSGLIQDLSGLKEVLKLRGVLLHLDVTFALGKMKVNFEELDLDFMTFGGEVLHGPKSSGALVAKSAIRLTPFIVGGLEQNGLRGGSLDIASFIGFVKACELMLANQNELNLEIARLRDLFEKKLVRELEGVVVLFQDKPRLSNVSVLAFDRIHSDSLLYALNKRGLCASFGGNAFQKLSHLLENMNFSVQKASSALSFSFSRYNTADEIQTAVGIIVDEVKRLRLMSQKLEFSHEK